jgi:uncharacterized protein (TIRG00374 family)
MVIAVSTGHRVISLIHRFEGRLPTAFHGKIVNVTGRFLEGLGSLRSVRLAGSILGLSLAAWICEATMYYTVGLGFHLQLGFEAGLLTTAFANLAAMVPAAPGNFGTFEIGAKTALNLFKVDSDQSVAYVGVLHLVLWAPVTILGFIYLWRANLSLRLLSQRTTSSVT